jgi:site-specific recombinase XerD
MQAEKIVHLTFDEAFSSFITDRELANRSSRTITSYSVEIGYLKKYLSNQGIHNFEDISVSLLKNFFLELGTHRNPGGVHLSYRTIKAFINFVCNEYDIERNPIKKVKIRAHNTEPLPEIPLETVQKLLNVCIGPLEKRNKALVRLMTDSGLRASEITALNIGDVDSETGYIKVLHGKGDKFRTGWIGDKTKKALVAYLSTRDLSNPSEPLFVTDEGRRLTFAGLRQIILRLCHKAVVPEYGLHSFRRLYAITLYRQGIDIYTISRLLGHSKVEVTRRYLNISNEDLKEVYRKASPSDLLE